MYSNHHIVVTCIPKNLSLLVTVAMSLIAGCTGHSAPESVYQEFILYSLDPFLPVDGPPVPKDQAFHGHRILG
ncbi:MAG: hypothetical protein KDA85_13770, partial [Planctomycetaceae bacterium]|nr:hypothetical protein [Planctomycetaceae bacterium]